MNATKNYIKNKNNKAKYMIYIKQGSLQAS